VELELGLLVVLKVLWPSGEVELAVAVLVTVVEAAEDDWTGCRPIAFEGDWTTLMALFEAKLGGGPEGAKPLSGRS